MIDKDLLNILTGYYKKQHLQEIYNQDKKRLTTDNVNAIISGLVVLSDYDNLMSGNIDSYVGALNSEDTDLRNLIEELSGKMKDQDDQIRGLIKASQASGLLCTSSQFASSALSANWAPIANRANETDYADLAGKVQHQIKIVTNSESEILTYDGSADVSVNKILSSKYSQSALHASTADTALHSESSPNADHAIQAQKAWCVTGAIGFITMNGDSLVYNGSQELVVNSVASSYSSVQSQYSKQAISSEFDIEGNQLNTLVKYEISQDNYDFPILFSTSSLENTDGDTNYPVKFNENILINPYIGAVKANYFLGTAVSATYAVCDEYKNPLNTRVCQNETSNNYNYPIALSFIDANKEPRPSQNNQILYPYQMRLNPYTNTIYASTDQENCSDAAIIKSSSTDNVRSITELERNYDSNGTYTHVAGKDLSPNFVGIATRASYDYYGDPINTKVLMHQQTDTSYNEQIRILGSKNVSSTGDDVDEVVYMPNLTFNNQTLTVNKNAIINEGLSSKTLNVSTNGYITDLSVTNNTSTGSLSVTNNTTIGGTLEVTGDTSLKSNLTVTSKTTTGSLSVTNNTSTGSLSVTNNTTIGGTLEVTSDTSLKSNLTVTSKTTTGSLSVTNNTSTGTLTVSTAASVGTNLSVTGKTTTNTLEVTTGASVGGSLTVGSSTSTNSLTVTNAGSIGTDLSVGNKTTTKYLNVTASGQVSDNFNVGKQLACNTLVANSTGTIGGTLTVGTSNKAGSSVIWGYLQVNGSTGSNGVVKSNFFQGTAQKANWADLAEIYDSDKKYQIGTLIQFGGEKEITIASKEVNAVISENPAVLMNASGKGQPIALAGKVKVLVKGKIKKFDKITLSKQNGIASVKKWPWQKTIGRALQDNSDQNKKLVMCVVQFNI